MKISGKERAGRCKILKKKREYKKKILAAEKEIGKGEEEKDLGNARPTQK